MQVLNMLKSIKGVDTMQLGKSDAGAVKRRDSKQGFISHLEYSFLTSMIYRM